MIGLGANRMIGGGLGWMRYRPAAAGGAFGGHATLATGLIAGWKFDETSGTTAADVLGNNDGTIVGATINQTGKIGKCYDFDGINDYVDVGDVTFFDELTECSISCWVNFDSFSNQNQSIVRKWNSAHKSIQLATGLTTDSARDEVYFSISDGSAERQVYTNNFNLQTSTWYHIVATWKASLQDTVIYINGSSRSIVVRNNGEPSEIQDSAEHLSIGGRYNQGSPDFFTGGLIDDVYIWSKVLTSSEVSALYNSGNGLSY